jgi:hypothetical protein
MSVELIKINPEELIKLSYREVIIFIYEAIPYHPVSGISKTEIDKAFEAYARLYHYLSNVHAILMIHYSGKVNDKFKLLKNSIEQALSVIKFQYNVLSRRVTINEEEDVCWTKTT